MMYSKGFIIGMGGDAQYHYGSDPKNAIALPGAFASVPDVGCQENFVFAVHVPEGTDVVTLYYFT
jgi:hypothetical protein